MIKKITLVLIFAEILLTISSCVVYVKDDNKHDRGIFNASSHHTDNVIHRGWYWGNRNTRVNNSEIQDNGNDKPQRSEQKKSKGNRSDLK